MDYEHTETPKKWTETSATVGPALLGAAAGLLAADVLHGNARRALGLGIAALGIAAITPKISGNIKRKVTGPQTKRGSQRTLDNIRGAGVSVDDYDADTSDDFSEVGIG